MALVFGGSSQPADRVSCDIDAGDTTAGNFAIWVTCDGGGGFDATFTKSDTYTNTWEELTPNTFSPAGAWMRNFIAKNFVGGANHHFLSSTAAPAPDQGNASAILIFDDVIDPDDYAYFNATGLINQDSFPLDPETPGVPGTLAISFCAMNAFRFGGPGGVTASIDSGFTQPVQVGTVMVEVLGTWFGQRDGINAAYKYLTNTNEIEVTWTLTETQGPAGFLFFIPYNFAPAPTTQTVATRRVRRFPHLSKQQVRLFWHQLQIDLEGGRALTTGQGSDPQVMLRWSDDGGHTWSPERWVSAGLRGQYGHRAIWRQLGGSRDRVFELIVSDPVPWTFLQGLAYIEEGTS